jgi:hypothetical protein
VLAAHDWLSLGAFRNLSHRAEEGSTTNLFNRLRKNTEITTSYAKFLHVVFPQWMIEAELEYPKYLYISPHLPKSLCT